MTIQELIDKLYDKPRERTIEVLVDTGEGVEYILTIEAIIYDENHATMLLCTNGIGLLTGDKE